MTISDTAKNLFNDADEWKAKVEQVVLALYEEGKEKEAKDNLFELDEQGKTISLGFTDLAGEREKDIFKHVEGIVDTTSLSRTVTIIFTIVIIILSTIVAFVTAKIITKPILRVTERI